MEGAADGKAGEDSVETSEGEVAAEEEAVEEEALEEEVAAEEDLGGNGDVVYME